MAKIHQDNLRTQLLISRPFVIYNLQNMDSFVILNITENKQYILYNHSNTNERSFYIEILKKT